MSYVLDGIKTAWEESRGGPGYFATHIVTCPCGWTSETGEHHDAMPERRFHYTHCPQAKVLPDRQSVVDLPLGPCRHGRGFPGGRCPDCGSTVGAGYKEPVT